MKDKIVLTLLMIVAVLFEFLITTFIPSLLIDFGILLIFNFNSNLWGVFSIVAGIKLFLSFLINKEDK